MRVNHTNVNPSANSDAYTAQDVIYEWMKITVDGSDMAQFMLESVEKAEQVEYFEAGQGVSGMFICIITYSTNC